MDFGYSQVCHQDSGGTFCSEKPCSGASLKMSCRQATWRATRKYDILAKCGSYLIFYNPLSLPWYIDHHDRRPIAVGPTSFFDCKAMAALRPMPQSQQSWYKCRTTDGRIVDFMLADAYIFWRLCGILAETAIAWNTSIRVTFTTWSMDLACATRGRAVRVTRRLWKVELQVVYSSLHAHEIWARINQSRIRCVTQEMKIEISKILLSIHSNDMYDIY